jgi:hypothetical protein
MDGRGWLGERRMNGSVHFGYRWMLITWTSDEFRCPGMAQRADVE